MFEERHVPVDAT